MNRKNHVVLLAVLCLLAPVVVRAADLPVEVSPKDENIRYIGRFDFSDPAGPRFAWTISTIKAKFSGTAINAKFKANGIYFQAVVDGEPVSVLGTKSGEAVYTVATGLKSGEHVVELVRRNEADRGGPAQFLGFQLEEGKKLLPLPKRADKRIMVIGDSISCGYGNEVQGPGGGNPYDKQNGYMAYGAIAARNFDAEAMIIAWSGRRLWPQNTMVDLFDRILPWDSKSKFDMKSWVPGVILINLGTNDMGGKAPEKKGWTDAYKAFIKKLRETAPDACIFCCTGSMWIGPLGAWNEYTKSVATDLNAEGDKKVFFLPFDIQDKDKDGLGGDWHPNLITHKKMAAKLSAAIEKEAGWKPVAAPSK